MREARETAHGVVRERVILVGLVLPDDVETAEPRLEELRRLAETAGATVVHEAIQRKSRIDAATFIGKGKTRELADLAEALGAGALLFNDDLSPAQVRNLEKVLKRRVVDRSELVLDIFALRARSREARVQVELAQYEYLRPRLRRMWTHLERMEGGAGGALGGIGTRGPGEKQLEVDRRLVRRRILDLKDELDALERQRRTRAAGREGYFRVSLVGYTNAGKSSLLRALTGADAFIEDRLFATLDTKTRTWTLPGNKRVFLSDTVGFLRQLPHHLVASFRATLAETLDADLLLHVLDAAHPDAELHREAVEGTLREIGAEGIPRLLVLNQVDRVLDRISLEALRRGVLRSVTVSAHTGEGLDRLAAEVLEASERDHVELTVDAAAGDGRLLAWLASRGTILETEYVDERAIVRVRLSRGDRARIRGTLRGGRLVVDSTGL